jgi:acetyl-CoA carboxylase biotin carboxyl carrier protein
MDLKDIRQLIKLVEKSEISELEIKEEGKEIRIVKNNKTSSDTVMLNPASILPYQPHVGLPGAHTSLPAGSDKSFSEPLIEGPVTAGSNQSEIRSPMVGTFYRAPAPDADPYVEIGQNVEAGQTLCIIEAMKLMNEIESDYTGKIVKILVENAQPVEYNQVLFLIEK